jgi:3-dehydroquinate synthase
LTTLEIRAASGLCRVIIGDSLANMGRYVPAGRPAVVVTDATVDRLYGPLWSSLAKIVLPPGEAAKTLATVERVYERLLGLGADRSTFVVAAGGGVVCDIAGFAASTYLRGLDFGFAPTTLVAQVDAGVGGKNGVDFRGYKNLIGVIQQPRFVLCDPEALRTLPSRDVGNGLAEMVKTAAIGSPELFERLEREPGRATALEREFILGAVHESLRVKASIVAADEKEAGERRRLNFGHTLGHAVEAVTGLGHGEAVGIGMAFAADLSVRRGFLAAGDRDRLKELLRRLGLPLGPGAAIAPEALVDALRKDKKRRGDSLAFVFLEAIGRPIVRDIPLAELESAVHDLR